MENGGASHEGNLCHIVLNIIVASFLMTMFMNKFTNIVIPIYI